MIARVQGDLQLVVLGLVPELQAIFPVRGATGGPRLGWR